MKKILANWNFVRALRLILGIIVAAQGIITKQFEYAILGFVLGGMALLNVGCCGMNACTVATMKTKKNKLTSEKISYEEVL
jgi:hypothetical protein